jgi:hypothetical protein
MNLTTLENLASRWRDDAARLRELGQDGPAKMSDVHASELEHALKEWSLEALTLEQAAGESGASYSTLQRKIASGDLPNAGRRGAPRVRRADLFGATPREDATDGPDLADQILMRRLG